MVDLVDEVGLEDELDELLACFVDLLGAEEQRGALGAGDLDAEGVLAGLEDVLLDVAEDVQEGVAEGEDGKVLVEEGALGVVEQLDGALLGADLVGEHHELVLALEGLGVDEQHVEALGVGQPAHLYGNAVLGEGRVRAVHQLRQRLVHEKTAERLQEGAGRVDWVAGRVAEEQGLSALLPCPLTTQLIFAAQARDYVEGL